MKNSAFSVRELVLLAVLLSGCAPATTVIPPNTASPAATLTPSITRTPSGPFPVGKYKDESREDVFFITFLPDGTYSTSMSAFSSKGTYVVADDQIVLTEVTPPDCGQSTYTWSFDGTTLILMKVQDPCGYHSDAWGGGIWIRQP